MKELLIFTFFLALSDSSFSQGIEWQNTIGGSDYDIMYEFSMTQDGGYFLGGHSLSNISGDKTENSLGGWDYWVVKIDSSGMIQWQNTIGGDSIDYLHSISQTSDGGCVLGGYSLSDISGDKSENSLGEWDYWVVKLDSLGVIQWQNTIGGNDEDVLWSISQTTDGGYILGGYSFSQISGDKTQNSKGGYDYWVVKLDSAGVILWDNTIGGSLNDLLWSISQTTDGGYILGGYSLSDISGDKTENSHGFNDYWVVKLDATGIIQWDNTIGGNFDDNLHSISQTSDGGYILGGDSNSTISGDKTENSQGGDDYWVVKLDSAGIIQWNNTIGGNFSDNLWSISQTTDGGYILGGYSFSQISGDKTEVTYGSDFWVIKLDTIGNTQWQNTIGGSYAEQAFCILQTSDEGFLVGGISNSDISVDKTQNSQGVHDYWIVKLIPDTFTSDQSNSILTPEIKIYPNVANNYLTVEIFGLYSEKCLLEIYNTYGQKVKSLFHGNLNSEHWKQLYNISDIKSGLYILKGVNKSIRFIKL